MNAYNPATNILDFACYIAKLTQSKLTGVFMENTLYAATADVSGRKSVLQEESAEMGDIKRNVCEKNIDFFNEACEKREVVHNIHRDRGIPVREIIEESRFADLIIVDPHTSLTGKYEGAPTRFIKVVLEDSECPVVIAPENFIGIDEIIFAYDGSKSSVFAIKEFTYLLPQFCHKKTVILQVNNENDNTITGKYKLKEWLKNHYVQTEIQLLHGDARYELFNHLLHKENVFLVMGAYGRSIVSHSLRSSHADMLIKMTNVPIFITHY